MKAKIIGILVVTLLIATAFPAVGTINIVKDNMIFPERFNGIEWEKTYGGDEADKFWDVQQTDDGGYIASGTTEESNNHYPWVLKVDSDGNEMWNWSITELTVDGEVLEIDYCWQSNVFQISDGGYIISLTALRTYYNDEEYEFGCIAKLDSEGDEEWINIQGDGFEWTIRNEYLLEVQDGILGVGDYMSPPQDIYGMDTTGCLFKINNIGELEWYNEYDYGEFVDKLNGICVTDDGFLLAGLVGIVAETYYDGWLVKTDSQGVKEWEKTFGGPYNDVFWGFTQTDNGDCMMVGWTQSFGSGNMDVWVLKTDSNGNEILNKTYGENKYDIAYGYDFSDDGGCFISGFSSPGFSADGWSFKIDSDGNVIWKEIYGGSGAQYLNGICSTDDGGFIVSGISGSWDGSKSDALLIKYSAFENQRPGKPAEPSGDPEGEPGKDYTFGTMCTDPDGDNLFFKWDWGDGNFSDWLDNPEASHNWSERGNYLVKVMAKDEHGGESDWSEAHAISIPRHRSVNRQYYSVFHRYLKIIPLLKLLFQRLGL